MSDIGNAMEKRGYIPLADNGLSAVGFKPSLKKDDGRMKEEVWFDTGRKMKDGITPITVAVRDTAQYDEYIKKGWKVVNPETSSGQAPQEKSEDAATEITAAKPRRGRKKHE